ncbi:hypothetical protein Misp03_35530 [Microbispora sp. NBRC 16548]|nr:hypothetical protein Misp03_35530 [Microbispora sp. NBRC 16548]
MLQRLRRGQDDVIKRLRRDHAEALKLLHPFSIPEFCERLSTWRGRPVYAHPFDPAAMESLYSCHGVSGICAKTRDADIIGYADNVPLALQVMIFFHEVGHLLAGHLDTSATQLRTVTLPRGSFPHFDGDIQAVMGRTNWLGQTEQEADMISMIFGDRLRRGWLASSDERPERVNMLQKLVGPLHNPFADE